MRKISTKKIIRCVIIAIPAIFIVLVYLTILFVGWLFCDDKIEWSKNSKVEFTPEHTIKETLDYLLDIWED